MNRVVFTPESAEQLAIRKQWWRGHRDASPDLLEREVSAALEHLAAHPEIFPVWGKRGDRVIRRCLLQRTRTHLYFYLESATATVVVVSAWGAVQGRRPPLP